MSQTVFSNKMAVHVWAQQRQAHGRNSNHTISFNGVELVSFNTAVALHYGAFVLKSQDTFTVTTGGKHMSHIDRSVGVPVVTVPGIFEYDKRFYDRKEYPTGPAIKKAILADILALSVSYAKRKRDTTRADDARHIARALTGLRTVCNHLNLTYPVGYGTVEEALGMTAKTVLRLAATAKREAAKAEKRQVAERAKDQDQMNSWLNGTTEHVPPSFRRYDAPALLTLRKGIVCTSQGAEAPLEHVKKAFLLYDKVTKSGVAWSKNGDRCRLGHFDLDSINTKGEAKAGCHKFTAKEIRRFRTQWGL